MDQHVILSVFGPDRPGLVDEVSRFIFERGGNIEDTRMVNLRGQFAMILLVTASSAAAQRLQQELPELQRASKVRAELHPTTGAPAASDALPYRLTATAIDQPGLAHRIGHALRQLSVNIESLEAHLIAAPYTGAPMFEMEAILSVPRATPIKELRRVLEQLCDELNIDHRLEPA